MKITTNLVEFKNIINEVLKLDFKDALIKENESLLIQAEPNKDVLASVNTLKLHYSRNLYSDVQELGQVVIPVTTLKLISKIKNNCEVVINDEEIKVGTKRITYKNMIKDYVKNKEIMYSNLFNITEDELNKMLEVSYTCATDESRPILTGINIMKNKFCAMDGYRLSVRESNQFRIDENITIPKELWKTMLKLISKKSTKNIEILISEDKQYIQFKFNDFTLESTLMEENYIKYESILPQENSLEVRIKNNNELLESLNFMSEATKKEGRGIIKIKTDDKFTLNINTKENSISDIVEVEYIQFKDMDAYFNIKCILEGFKINKDREVTFCGTRDVNPFTIKHKDGLELILPVIQPKVR